jgi:hypothetical protein
LEAFIALVCLAYCRENSLCYNEYNNLLLIFIGLINNIPYLLKSRMAVWLFVCRNKYLVKGKVTAKFPSREGHEGIEVIIDITILLL